MPVSLLQAFPENVKKRHHQFLGNDDAYLRPVVLGRKALIGVRKEAAEFQDQVLPGRAHIDDVGVNRHNGQLASLHVESRWSFSAGSK